MAFINKEVIIFYKHMNQINFQANKYFILLIFWRILRNNNDMKQVKYV